MVITGISDDIVDDKSEDTVTLIMEDVDVIVQNGDIEACHRMKNLTKKLPVKKTIKFLFNLFIVSIARRR